MQDEGFILDSEHARRLKLAYDLTLERLQVDTSDHEVKKRLARTLIKIAKRRAADVMSEILAEATVGQVCDKSALRTELRRGWKPYGALPLRPSSRGTSCNGFALAGVPSAST